METIILDIEKLKKEVWAIAKKKIPALQEQIEAISEVDMSELTASLQAQQTALNALETELDTLSKAQTTQAGKITALETKTTTHDNSISQLQSAVSEINTTLDELSDLVNTNTTNISNLSTSVTSHSSTIEHLSSNASYLENRLDEAESTIRSHTTQISANTQNIASHSAHISTILSDVASHGTMISSLQSSVSTLSSKVTTNTNNISTLQTDLTSMSNQLQSAKTQLTNSVNTLNVQVVTLQNEQESISQTADEALTLAQSVRDAVDNLDTSGGGSSSDAACLTGELLYDMRSSDETINHGKTTGIQSKEKLTIDLSSYRYVKIFTMFGTSTEDQLLIDIANKKGYIFSSIAWMNNYNLCTIKVRIPTNLSYVYFENFGLLTLSDTPPTFSVGDTDLKSSFIIYRIEGIK